MNYLYAYLIGIPVNIALFAFLFYILDKEDSQNGARAVVGGFLWPVLLPMIFGITVASMVIRK